MEVGNATLMTPSVLELHRRMVATMSSDDLTALVTYLSDARNDLSLRPDNLGNDFSQQALGLLNYARTNRCLAQLVALIQEAHPITLTAALEQPLDWAGWAQAEDAEEFPAVPPTLVERDGQLLRQTLSIRGWPLYLMFGVGAVLLIAVVVLILNTRSLQRSVAGPGRTATAANATFNSLPHLTDQTLQAIDMISASEGWAVGDDGTILHYKDGAWSLLTPAPTSLSLYAVQMLGPDDGWAVGSNHLILHYKNGSWQRVTSASVGDEGYYALAMVNREVGWLGTFAGSVVAYRDGAWGKDDGIFRDQVYGLSMISVDEGWAISSGGRTKHYQNGTWQDGAPVILDDESNPNPNLRSIAMLSPSEGWTVGEGVIAHYKDGDWQPQSVTVTLTTITMLSPTDGWAVGGNLADDVTAASCVIYHYDGKGWQPVACPISNPLSSLDMVSPTEGWAVAEYGIILHYKDGVWRQVTR